MAEKWAAIETDIMASIASFGSGPEAQKAFAEFAAEKRDEVIARDKPTSTTVFVDGRQNAPLDSVKLPDGVARFEFGYLDEIVAGVLAMLVSKSPYRAKKPGADVKTHYRDEHLVFINGVEVTEIPDTLPPNAVVVLVNLQPYSRKIEAGFSAQAPSGVYEQVARMARRQWGNTADISFGYDNFPGAGWKAGTRTVRKTIGNIVRGQVGKRTTSDHKSNDRFPTITIQALSS